MVIMDNLISSIKPIVFKILYNLQILRFFPQFYFHYEVKKYIKKGDVVIDIGANWGCYTRLFKGWGAFVYAVEPIYKIFKKLKADIRYRYALGNDDNQYAIMKHWRNTSGAYKLSNRGEHFVHKIRGSRLFENLDKIDFIKIDVEGSELPIIEDMAELILKHKPVILIETGKINEVLSYLRGYKIINQFRNDYLIG